MTTPHTSLSGFWTGVYDYPENIGQPVPFTAIITDIDGDLSGDIDEPHMGLGATDGPQSSALNGSFAGGIVTFTKTYLNRGHHVDYRGDVDSALTRIEGLWTVPGEWSGPFVMDRARPPVKRAERRVEETVGGNAPDVTPPFSTRDD